MAGINWTCGHCNRPQVRNAENSCDDDMWLRVGQNAFDAELKLQALAVACQNPECGKVSLRVKLIPYVHSKLGYLEGSPLQTWSLLPESHAKPQPDCVPEVLQRDYYEACRIVDLSPKSSATLARRCLQGMIRDFCKIAKATLDLEVKALDALLQEGKAPSGVTRESVEAIDHVRSIGNIGAHMEKDVNLVIDIEPDEAKILIELVETLFQEWYVARFAREERLLRLAQIRAEKDAQKKPLLPSTG